MTNYRLLFIQPGAQAWEQVPLAGQSFTIGRTSENNLVLEDEKVSRQHALLHLDARGVWIMDRGSSNGVIIGGQRIPANEWKLLPFNANFTIGSTTLRLEAIQPAASDSPPAYIPPPGISQRPSPVARPASLKKPLSLPVLGLLVIVACVCLAGGGVAAGLFLPRLLSPKSTTIAQPLLPGPGQPTPTLTAVQTSAPPKVIDSLPASPGAGPVQDDQGVSLSVPAGSLESGQQAYLERASLSPGMQNEIEKAYQVESLAYAVRLQDGQDGVGRLELSLPAKSPDSRLAVLIDDRWLGILETPAQEGVFHITPGAALASGGQTYFEPGSAGEQAPNRYLVLTPKSGSSQVPQGSVKLASLVAQGDPDGKACVAEFWIANQCWRNSESSVYVFWESDVPANLKDTEYLRVIDTIKAVAALMGSYQQKGFTAAAISPSNPAYIIVEAGASEPYYSFKTGNVYVPWDIIGGIGDPKNRCTIAHEFFHWIEDEEYRMGVAAISGPKSWWLETSAENGAFLLDESCIDKNLTQYGLVNTNGNVLGLQAAPFQWEGGEQARYIHALQLYLSICDGGAKCALSEQAWIQAINSGAYPMEGSAVTAYENNAKDLGRFLLGAAPQESRAGAVIPPSARSGNSFGDYLALRTSPRGIWDYGLTMNQFTKPNEQQMKVEAKIAKGGVYPLWVSNGTATPMGGGGGNTGLPGLLEILPGPAFWLKQDQSDPVFYPAGKGLKLGPISDKLGIGQARLVAVAPDAESTFQANLTLADFSGDWSAELGALSVTPVDCPGYSASESGETPPADPYLQMFSGYGTYVKDSSDAADLNLTWQGTLPEGALGSSEVTVEADKITLHYRIELPKPAQSFASLGLPWPKPGSRAGQAWPLPRPQAFLSAWPLLPVLVVIPWLHRRRPKWRRLALAGLILLGALGLSGCFGLAIWGSIDVTYTFDKLEYVDSQQAAQTAAPGAEALPAVTWKLSSGQVVYDLDLTFEASTEDSDGTTTQETPCKLTATGSATGTIGPEGSVSLPDTGE